MKLIYHNRPTLNRILLHILFWVVSIVIFGYLFKISDTISRIDIIYSALFLLSIFPGVYINLLLLIPWSLNKKRYTVYFILFSTLIVGITGLNQLTFSHISDILLPDYYFVAQFNYLETGILVTTFLIGTTFFKLSKSWFKLQELDHQITKIEKENIDNQLKALKAQINPHFLFNSLNVLYALALKNAKETPETIIKLADILRYVIYDSNRDTVTIASEVNLIRNYLNLQKHRIENGSEISFTSNILYDTQLTPMLFLPLIENSFKHGVKGDTSDTYVHINLMASEEEVIFEIENNKGTNDCPPQDSKGGIGLKNIQKRLKLLYPDRHHFVITEDEKKFKVTLTLKP